ncbi:hypothetical protein ONE63_006011 [Megalurothrips usitatus]|uniref:xylose isomerase n=1 Tax=Megalurothrips usitatus TaxID=439358 RepID=A0AAV7XS14_9NEOP|nr:hypothetical protein ONE63_006011 [Megalurothrips usitatus]
MSKLTPQSQQQQLVAMAAKRQKLAAAAAAPPLPRDVARTPQDEYFPGVTRVEFRPDAGPEDTLCYRFYNPSERLHGRSMEDWLRPAISFGDALRLGCGGCGSGVCGRPGTVQLQRSWDDGTGSSSSSLENYHRRIRAAFELCSKLGIKLWAAWDRDLAPEGDSLEETQRNLEESVDLCLELQQRGSGPGAASPIRPLWLAADLHSHHRYGQGAGTAPDAGVVAVAGSQVRRALQAAQRLSAECFLFWGGRDGYSSPLNTDPARELRGYGRLLRMTAEFRDRLGYRGQLLLETVAPRPRSPRAAHGAEEQRRYDDCAAGALSLLKQHGLDRHYKLSAPPGHQALVSTAYGVLGCINATNRAFPPDLREATLAMKSVVEQGGLQPGGLLVDVPVQLQLRRDAADGGSSRDLVASYVAVIDGYARALRAAVKMVSDGAFSRNLQQRYLTFHSGFGARLSSGEATLEDCEEHARKLQLQQQQAAAQSTAADVHGHDWCLLQHQQTSRPEHWEAVCARYIDAVPESVRE